MKPAKGALALSLHRHGLVFVAALIGCGGTGAAGGGGPGSVDGAGVPDGQGSPAESGAPAGDGGVEAPWSADASHTVDGTAMFDGGNASDGAPQDASLCDGAVADADFQRGCQNLVFEVVSTPGQTPQLHLLGLGGWGDCTTIESLNLQSFGQTIAPLQLAPDPSNPAYIAYVGDAPQPLIDACATDGQRFDAFGVLVQATQPQGRFTAQCGGNPGGWPPGNILTCHTGLSVPPTYPAVGGAAEVQGTPSSTTLQAQFPHVVGGAVTSLDPTAHIIPASMSGPLQAFDTSGWSTTLAEAMLVGQGTVTMVLLSSAADPLATVCVSTSGPMPAFVARLSGSTASGPFTSEVYVQDCPRL